MNTIAKVSAASALALGFGVAHASILYPASGGDVLLFAEVLNGTSVVGSYAGDTGVHIGSTIPTGTILSSSADTNLNTLLTVAASAGNTLEWAVEGGTVASSGNWTSTDQYVTTLTNGPSQLASRTGGNTTQWSNGLTGTIDVIDQNSHGTNSVFATSLAAGGLYDVSSANNIANWYANGSATAQTGIGSSTELYKVTMGAGQTSNIVLTGLGTVSLTNSGLTFSTGGGGGSTVPLPAAVWLLGSGLLGLAGVGRRKLAAA
jgi:hypothetical protein